MALRTGGNGMNDGVMIYCHTINYLRGMCGYGVWISLLH
jgi:hypothetical protein